MAYPGSSTQRRRQCSTRISAGADVGSGSLKKPATECLTLSLSWGMSGVTIPIVRNATGVSALNCTAKPKSPAVWACLGVDPLDMPRSPYRMSEGKHSQ